MLPEQLFRKKTYKRTAAKTVLFFICPFGTKLWKVRLVINKLRRAGYTVVAYDTTNDVFFAGDPSILPELVKRLNEDMATDIKHYTTQGIQSFAIFGSSLGAFIAYNSISVIPELRYGVFNTGGNIAEAMWRFEEPRQIHLAKGFDLEKLKKAWHSLQYPNFSKVKGNSYIFVSSPNDKVAPLEDIDQYLQPIRDQGATVTITTVRARGHASAVIAGFRRSVQLLADAKAQIK